MRERIQSGVHYWWIWLLLTLSSCQALPTPISPPTPPTPTTLNPAIPPPATPTLSVQTPTPLPTTPTLPPDSGWQSLYPGFERRLIRLPATSAQPAEQLYILRIDPTLYQFGIAYQPGAPQQLAQWQAQTEALLVINGGFFTESYMATGLIIVDGVASGVSYGDFAGMFTVTTNGPEIRWIAQRPYAPDEPLLHALQSFPLLVKPGGILGFPDEDGARARRTVIAQDENGRILFIVTPQGSFTLHQLSRYLVESDLNLHIALNLDGGPSSGFRLTEPFEEVPAFGPLPAIITVHPK